MCAMTTILFLGGWLPPIDVPPLNWVPGIIWFFLKLVFVFFMFAMVKAIVPRYRYDQLMRIGWKIFLPTTLVAVAVVGGHVAYFGSWDKGLTLDQRRSLVTVALSAMSFVLGIVSILFYTT
eukprot:gene20216-25892_t